MTETTEQLVFSSDDYVIKKVVSVNSYSGQTRFSVYEHRADGSPRCAWERTGQPRASIDVTVYHPDLDGWPDPGSCRLSEVSWPSTSDRRPGLAAALSRALMLAVEEARRWDRKATIDYAIRELPPDAPGPAVAREAAGIRAEIAELTR